MNRDMMTTEQIIESLDAALAEKDAEIERLRAEVNELAGVHFNYEVIRRDNDRLTAELAAARKAIEQAKQRIDNFIRGCSGGPAAIMLDAVRQDLIEVVPDTGNPCSLSYAHQPHDFCDGKRHLATLAQPAKGDCEDDREHFAKCEGCGAEIYDGDKYWVDSESVYLCCKCMPAKGGE